MSDENAKLKHSKRLHKDEAAIKKQVKIAKQHGVDPVLLEDQPHRYAKHHAMDCGRPECGLCSSPRKLFGELSIQEKRFYQEEIE